MADILEEWINDANAYELLNIYRIEQQVLYQFVNKSDDFYISLLNRMFFTMRNRELTLEDKKERLLRIVTGLLVYSEKTTAGNFDGVNRNNNLLYIAAIYVNIMHCRNYLFGGRRDMNLKMNLRNCSTA